MANKNNSFLVFIAGAATAVAVGTFFKSENGAKFRKSVARTLKNLKTKANQQVNTDWVSELEDSAKDAFMNIKSKIKS